MTKKVVPKNDQKMRSKKSEKRVPKKNAFFQKIEKLKKHSIVLWARILKNRIFEKPAFFMGLILSLFLSCFASFFSLYFVIILPIYSFSKNLYLDYLLETGIFPLFFVQDFTFLL